MHYEKVYCNECRVFRVCGDCDLPAIDLRNQNLCVSPTESQLNPTLSSRVCTERLLGRGTEPMSLHHIVPAILHEERSPLPLTLTSFD